MTVFAAASGYAGRLEREWVPTEGTLDLEMVPLSEGGSVIFPDRTGYIPGLTGRLNPIRDSQDRTYIYASNIAVNGGKPQACSLHPRRGTASHGCRGTGETGAHLGHSGSGGTGGVSAISLMGTGSDRSPSGLCLTYVSEVGAIRGTSSSARRFWNSSRSSSRTCCRDAAYSSSTSEYSAKTSYA